MKVLEHLRHPIKSAPNFISFSFFANHGYARRGASHPPQSQYSVSISYIPFLQLFQGTFFRNPNFFKRLFGVMCNFFNGLFVSDCNLFQGTFCEKVINGTVARLSIYIFLRKKAADFSAALMFFWGVSKHFLVSIKAFFRVVSKR